MCQNWMMRNTVLHHGNRCQICWKKGFSSSMKILTAILTQSLRMKVEEDEFPCLLSNLSFLSDMQTDQLDLSVLTHRVCQVLRQHGQTRNNMDIGCSHHIFWQIWRRNFMKSIVKMLYNSSSVLKTEFWTSKLLENFKCEILPGLALTKWLI